MQQLQKRLPIVDLLRALSILFVLLNHVNIRLRIAKVPYTVGLPDQLIRSLVWNGQRGVQIFFAISGFLITTTALRRFGTLDRIDILRFYRLRFARIAPLLLLLLVTLSLLHLSGTKNFVIPEKQGGLPRALLAALTFHINVLEATRGYLPGSWDILWSLSVEEMFYLFFPLCARLRIFPGILLILIAAGPWTRTHSTGLWQEYSYLGGMDAIALGCATAIFTSQIRFSNLQLRALLGTGAGLLALTLCFVKQTTAWGLPKTGLDDTLLACGACFVLAAAAQLKWTPPRAFSPILTVGASSYEIYLTHMFVVFGLFQLFLNAGKPMHLVMPFFLGTILISGLLGHLVSTHFSEPLNFSLRKTLLSP